MNEKLIEKFNEVPELSKSSASLFNHILSAHHIWNSRIISNKAKLGVWQEIDASEYKKINADNYQLSLEIIRVKDMEEIINYTNTIGEKFSNSVRDILFHVINHSNYHRAQIATILKNEGTDPIISDYIFYKR